MIESPAEVAWQQVEESDLQNGCDGQYELRRSHIVPSGARTWDLGHTDQLNPAFVGLGCHTDHVHRTGRGRRDKTGVDAHIDPESRSDPGEVCHLGIASDTCRRLDDSDGPESAIVADTRSGRARVNGTVVHVACHRSTSNRISNATSSATEHARAACRPPHYRCHCPPVDHW